MNNNQLQNNIFKLLVISLFAFFTNSIKAQENEYEDFNKILTLDSELYQSVYDTSQIKEKIGTLNLYKPYKQLSLRLFLYDKSVIRGQLIAYHENGLFVYSSNQNTFGFYPFSKINKLKIWRSPTRIIILSSIGFIGSFTTLGILAQSYGYNNLENAIAAGVGTAAVFQAIFLPLNELFRHYAHFNWLINQNKIIGQKLYKEILTKKSLWLYPKNLTGFVN